MQNHMNANNRQPLFVHQRLLIALLLVIPVWYVMVPRVEIKFSNEGRGVLGFILNTQHDIYRGDIMPGGTTGGVGHLFPNNDFFMQFDWFNNGKHHCFSVIPKWPKSYVFIGPDGSIDKNRENGTDVDDLVPCLGEK